MLNSRTDVRDVIWDVISGQMYGDGPDDVVVRISFARKGRRFCQWQVEWCDAQDVFAVDEVLGRSPDGVAA